MFKCNMNMKRQLMIILINLIRIKINRIYQDNIIYEKNNCTFDDDHYFSLLGSIT